MTKTHVLEDPCHIAFFSFCLAFSVLGDPLARDPPQLWERLKIKKINKRPLVQTSPLLAVGTGAPTTIGVAPALRMLLHKMAKR